MIFLGSVFWGYEKRPISFFCWFCLLNGYIKDITAGWGLILLFVVFIGRI